VTGYRVSPPGVRSTLERVRTEAEALGRTLESVWGSVPSSSGGSQVVAAALGGYVEAARDEMRAVSDRLESAPGAMSRAVAAFIEGDEEMAAEHRQAMSGAEAGMTGPLGPPSGVYGPPVPERSEPPMFDPSRFGAGTTAPLQPKPVFEFDPKQFGGKAKGGS
jgi:hypothetical protein